MKRPKNTTSIPWQASGMSGGIVSVVSFLLCAWIGNSIRLDPNVNIAVYAIFQIFIAAAVYKFAATRKLLAITIFCAAAGVFTFLMLILLMSLFRPHIGSMIFL